QCIVSTVFQRTEYAIRFLKEGNAQQQEERIRRGCRQRIFQLNRFTQFFIQRKERRFRHGGLKLTGFKIDIRGPGDDFEVGGSGGWRNAFSGMEYRNLDGSFSCYPVDGSRKGDLRDGVQSSSGIEFKAQQQFCLAVN